MMNQIAYVLGGAMVPLIIVLPILGLVRPRTFAEAFCVVASPVVLVLALEVRGGVHFDGKLMAEGMAAISLSMLVYLVARKIISAVINSDPANANCSGKPLDSRNEKNRLKFVLIGCGLVSFLAVFIALINVFSENLSSSNVNLDEKANRSEVKIIQPPSICYILVNNEKAVKISGEIDGYVTTEYNKNGHHAFVYFKKGTSEKQVRDYWWKHMPEVMDACGFDRTDLR